MRKHLMRVRPDKETMENHRELLKELESYLFTHQGYHGLRGQEIRHGDAKSAISALLLMLVDQGVITLPLKE